MLRAAQKFLYVFFFSIPSPLPLFPLPPLLLLFPSLTIILVPERRGGGKRSRNNKTKGCISRSRSESQLWLCQRYASPSISPSASFYLTLPSCYIFLSLFVSLLINFKGKAAEDNLTSQLDGKDKELAQLRATLEDKIRVSLLSLLLFLLLLFSSPPHSFVLLINKLKGNGACRK